jgi:hypothetical protein
MYRPCDSRRSSSAWFVKVTVMSTVQYVYWLPYDVKYYAFGMSWTVMWKTVFSARHDILQDRVMRFFFCYRKVSQPFGKLEVEITPKIKIIWAYKKGGKSVPYQIAQTKTIWNKVMLDYVARYILEHFLSLVFASSFLSLITCLILIKIQKTLGHSYAELSASAWTK